MFFYNVWRRCASLACTGQPPAAPWVHGPIVTPGGPPHIPVHRPSSHPLSSAKVAQSRTAVPPCLPGPHRPPQAPTAPHPPPPRTLHDTTNHAFTYLCYPPCNLRTCAVRVQAEALRVQGRGVERHQVANVVLQLPLVLRPVPYGRRYGTVQDTGRTQWMRGAEPSGLPCKRAAEKHEECNVGMGAEPCKSCSA